MCERSSEFGQHHILFSKEQIKVCCNTGCANFAPKIIESISFSGNHCSLANKKVGFLQSMMGFRMAGLILNSQPFLEFNCLISTLGKQFLSVELLL